MIVCVFFCFFFFSAVFLEGDVAIHTRRRRIGEKQELRVGCNERDLLQEWWDI